MAISKVIGLLCLLSCFTGFGFLKAYELKARKTALEKFLKGIKTLSGSVLLCKNGIAPLFADCFPANSVFITNEKPQFCGKGLSTQDVSLLTEFFEGFGKTSALEESKRCEFYALLLEKNLQEAVDTYGKLFSLYRSLGFLSGLFVCIFLL